MINIQDSSIERLPSVVDGNFASFFQREEMNYLTSSSWKKVCYAFGQEMKLQVSPCDIEELKRFLRKKREEILEAMRKGFVTYVVNTKDLSSANDLNDGYELRRCAVENNVTIFTALDTVRVLLDALEEMTLCVSTIDAE